MQSTDSKREILRLIDWQLAIALESPNMSRPSRIRLKRKIGQLISYWEAK